MFHALYLLAAPCLSNVGWDTAMPDPIFNISDFGAKGDNLTSNTHAFKAAVAKIEDAGAFHNSDYLSRTHARTHTNP